jgi:hypothetical protein
MLGKFYNIILSLFFTNDITFIDNYKIINKINDESYITYVITH